MSTPPKDPKPGTGSALEQTFLGVAPAAPEPPPARPAGTPAAGGSAIIAAPMISVSGERTARPAVTPAAVGNPAPAVNPPARSTALQGGWQSAGVPRPQATDQTALHGTPGAWPMPPAPAAQVPAGMPGGHRPGVNSPVPPALTQPPAPARAQPPRPAPGSSPRAVPGQAGPRTPPPNPRPGNPADGGLHHTALASDYLRAAREAALGAGPAQVAARPATPALPGVERMPLRSPQPQPARSPQPAQPHQTATSGPLSEIPVSVAPPTAVSVARPGSSPAVTAAPPATAPLSEPGPLPEAGGYQPALAMEQEPEPLHGPPSIGTQASVAPPLGLSNAGRNYGDGPGASPSPFAAAPLQQAVLAPAPNPVRAVPPQAMAGTMLDRTPSVPGSALAQAAGPPTSGAHSATGPLATRFEQVPSARGSLSQQATGFGLQIPIDQSAADWGRTGVEQLGGAGKGKSSSPLRLVLLAVLAIMALGFAFFGKQLLDGSQGRSARAEGSDGEQPAADDGRSPDQATLTNLPGSANAPVANALPSAGSLAPTPAGGLPVAQAVGPTPSASAAAASPAPVALIAPNVAGSAGNAQEPVDAKAAAEARKAAEESASPESKLAAQAARHVLSARFAEALPLYRQLQQSAPQNVAYAAMVRVLEQKTAATSAKSGAPQ
jgi:hypothetical protein